MQKIFEAQIFLPSSSFDWRINSKRLFYGAFILLGALLIIDNSFQLDAFTTQVLTVTSFTIMLTGSIWGYHAKERKHGELKGKLLISQESIQLDCKKYNWDEISDFSFNVQHVLNEDLWSEFYNRGRYAGGPAYSQGVDNWIDFQFKKERFKVFFQLQSPSHKVEFSRIMKLHFYENHIELNRTYDGLHLEYEQIQELKSKKDEYQRLKCS